VNNERRNRRIRLLIGRLNKERKKQAAQIDILCNDLIAAQKCFIKSLKVIGFAAEFYEAIIGLTDLNELLSTAGNLIKEQITDVNVAFFLLRSDNFEMHVFESDQPIGLEDKRIENFFTAELVDNISKSNRICTIDDMLVMGLASNPRYIEKVEAAGVPLINHGCSLGFVLLYRSSQRPFTPDELKSIDEVAPGLARSITSCRVLIGSA
jgi:GAF domain-containing protein